MNTASNAAASAFKRQRDYAVLCLDRLKAIVEHAHLSQREIMSLTAEINEIYGKHVSMPEPTYPDDAKEWKNEHIRRSKIV
jgi:hypothetical protein